MYLTRVFDIVYLMKYIWWNEFDSVFDEPFQVKTFTKVIYHFLGGNNIFYKTVQNCLKIILDQKILRMWVGLTKSGTRWKTFKFLIYNFGNGTNMHVKTK